MSGYWKQIGRYNHEYYMSSLIPEEDDDEYVIDLWFMPGAGTDMNDASWYPHWAVTPFPDTVKTLEEAQAWAIAMWRIG